MRRVKSDFDFDSHLISFIMENTFFAEISRHVQKYPTNDIPTGGVCFNPKTEDLEMVWNPEFVKAQSSTQVRGLLKHEFYHIVFKHLTSRKVTDPKFATLDNIAKDCAINSLIVDEAKRSYGSKDKNAENPLPDAGIIPGEWPRLPDGRELTKEEKQTNKLAEIISKLPPLMSSEWYFHRLKQDIEKELEKGESDEKGEGEGGKGAGNGQGGMTLEDLVGQGKQFGFDEHDSWDDIPEEQRAIAEGKIRDIVGKAVQKADASANGWGNIPADLVEDIRRSVTKIVNWRSVLKQFHGSLIRGRRRTSIKRINKRYPYIHPGVSKGYTAKLLIAIDQSGSVDNEMLEMFFSELRNLNKSVTIDILHFDCVADIKDVETWSRGTNPLAKRTRAGGTNFDAPTSIVNDPKNRGRWDGLLIMTDGEAPKPGPSRIKRGWIIGQNQKLMFNTDELVIQLDDGKVQHTGSVR